MAGGPEGGNFYEDAILREQNIVERQEERSALDERLEAVNIQEETQDSLSQFQDDLDLNPQVQEALGFFEGIDDNEGKTIEGYDVFKQYIISASSEIKSDFIDFEKGLIFENNIKNFGRFPVNDFEAQQFFIDGITNIEVEVINNKAKIAEIESEVAETESEVAETKENIKEKGQHILSIAQYIDLSPYSSNYQRYSELIKREDWNDGEIQELEDIQTGIIRNIAQNRKLEQEILPQAYEQGPEVFSEVTRSLVNLDEGFQARIDAWEMTPDFPELPPEQMTRVSGALGTRVDDVSTDAKQSGNIFTIDGIDGAQVNYDVVSNERSITLDGYTIETSMDDAGDYQTPKLAYMRVEQANLPQVQKLVAAGEALSDAQWSSEEVGKIKSTLKESLGYTYYGSLGIDLLTTAGEIQSKIQSEFTQHNDVLTEARNEYRDELIRLRDQHAGVLAARDKRVRSTLGLLKGTGITQMPQSVFHQIADAVNVNPAEYGFETQINLEEGILGFDASGDNENIDRVRFAHIVNVMLGVEEGSEYAINSDAVNGIGNTAIQDRNAFNTFVMNKSGWHDVGAANTILERLRNRDKK